MPEIVVAALSSVKSLVVNADDFGLTPGVNRGIIQGHRQGIVTSTTLMVNMPGFYDAVVLAKENPCLAVGLHLNLTYGHPVSPLSAVSSLIGEDGLFQHDPGFVLANARAEEILAEFRAQTDRFLATGLTPSHIDTHHDLHQSARFLDQAAAIAGNLGVTIRCLDERALLARGITPRARFVKFFAGRDGVRRLLAVIASLQPGVTEIPCHPGYDDDQLRSLSTLNSLRELELEAVTDPRVICAIEASGVRLTNYRELCKGLNP